MRKTMKYEEWSGKVRAGDWVAFKKDSQDEAVVIAKSYESAVKKVKAMGREGDVAYAQVPPRNCSLTL